MEKDEFVVCLGENTHEFPIINGVIRFVDVDVSEEYSSHWGRFATNPPNQKKCQQAEKFVSWVNGWVSAYGATQSIWLDIGCGDGNHIPFMPKDALKIVLDYSGVVDVVKNRYRDVPNLFVLQADAQALPIRNSCIDVAISYGCLNCVPDPHKGVGEAFRVVKVAGLVALWGYGTRNKVIRIGLRLSRWIYHTTKIEVIRKLLVKLLVPSLIFIPNSSNIRPWNSSCRELEEIVSTNMAPPYLHIFGNIGWEKFVNEKQIVISDYELYCGRLYRKVV